MVSSRKKELNVSIFKIVQILFLITLLIGGAYEDVHSAEDDPIGDVVGWTLDEMEGQSNEEGVSENEMPDLIPALEFSNRDVKEVFDWLQKSTGTTIKYDSDLKMEITLYLEDARLDDVLRIIGNMAGLAYIRAIDQSGLNTFNIISQEEFLDERGVAFNEKLSSEFVLLNYAKSRDVRRILTDLKSDQGIIMLHQEFNAVAMIDQKQRLKEMLAMIAEIDVSLETEIFELNDLSFEDVEDKIRVVLTKKIGRLQFDERSNSIIVTDNQEKIQEVRIMIEELKNNDKAVKVDVKILQITLSDEHIDGVDWGAIISDHEKLYISHDEDKEGALDIPIGVGSLSEEDFPILLEALDTVGVVSEVSDKKFLLLNGQKGDIVLNDESLWKDRDIDKLKRKIKSKIPLEFHFIARWKDRTDMTMTITSAVVGQAQNIDGLKANQKDKNYASAINYTNESTIVIGGIFIDKVVESTWKIPLLGDIPFLGIVFRSEGQVERKTEVIIFLTSYLENKR